MAYLDDIDRSLIAALRHDARRSVSDLAATLGIARATVRARLDRLEREKLILGYTIVVKGDIEAAPVRGVMSIELEGRAQEGVVKALAGMPEVVAVHTTNGRWDLIAEIRTDDLVSLDAVLNRIRQLPAIRVTETNLLLSTVRSRTVST